MREQSEASKLNQAAGWDTADPYDPFYIELKSMVPCLAKAQRDYAATHDPAVAFRDMLDGDVAAYLIAARRTCGKDAVDDLLDRIEADNAS